MAKTVKTSSTKENHDFVSKRLLDILNAKKDDSSSTASAAYANPFVQKAIRKAQVLKKSELSSSDIKILNKRFMSGHLPRARPVDNIHDSDDDSDDDDENKEGTSLKLEEKSTFFVKAIKLQIKILTAIRNYAVGYASKYGNSWIRMVIPTHQITTLISFIIYTYILNAEFLMFFLPLLFFLVSFVVMIISTLRLLRNERRFKEFVAWSDLLISIDSALDVVEAENNYFKNHVSPLISLLPALVLNILSYSATSTKILPISELAFFSLILSFVSGISYLHRYDITSCGALIFHLLASILEGLGRISIDYTAFSLSLVTFNEICFNLSLSVLLRVVSVGLFFSMMFQPRFKSLWGAVLHGLAPVLLVLLWWEMFTLFFLDSNIHGLFRAGLETIVLLLSIPLSIFIFTFFFIRWLLYLHLLKIVVFSLALILPLIYFKFSYQIINFNSVCTYIKNKFSGSLRALAIAVLIITAIIVVIFYRPSGQEIFHSSLTWNDYNRICLSKEKNQVDTKRLCHQLFGHRISWNGTVEDVAILDIDNKFESALSVLPSFLANSLSCLYGERYVSDEKICSQTSESDLHACFVTSSSFRECHLDYYNSYKFAITVVPSDSNNRTQFKILAENRFKDVILHLKPGMRISYKGLLNPDLGTLELDQIHVFEKNFKNLRKPNSNLSFGSVLTEAGRSLVRFFFSPFLTYKNDEEDC